MSESRVKLWFRRFAVINLIMSILFFAISKKLELDDRISGTVVINIAYSMFFFFISRGMVRQYKWIKKISNSSFSEFQLSLILNFTKVFKIGALIFLIVTVLSSIARKEFYIIFAFCVPIGIYLGASLAKVRMESI